MVSTVLTWNVRWATPRSPRRHEILHRIFRHTPDIVCLTEVDSQLLADRSGHVIQSRPDGIVAKEANDKRKVVLWSKEPWEQIDDLGHVHMPPGRFVSGVTKAPLLGEVTVIGVCIPWPASRTRWTNDGIKRKRWEDHRKYLEILRDVLQRAPLQRLIVLGDFNQKMSGGKAPKDVREALHAAFRGNMEIATADLDVIDHIALTPELLVRNRAVVGRFHDDRELSDHCGVVADVAVDHVFDRFTEVPFDGLRVDGDGNVVDPPPGPARDRAVGVIEGWRRYWKDGDSSLLIELGVLPSE